MPWPGLKARIVMCFTWAQNINESDVDQGLGPPAMLRVLQATTQLAMLNRATRYETGLKHCRNHF